jgi:mono/diheme cytochrome c family protein
MKAGSWSIALFLALAGVLAAAHGLRRDYTRPNWQMLPDMVNSPAYATYSPNPVLRDGMTQQPPVPGAIARGQMPLHYAPTTQSALQAGEELTSPFAPGDTAALDRGRMVYQRFCVMCHGPGGAGDGIVATRGFPPPPSLLADNARQMKDGRIFHIATYGQGNMPPYAGQVSRPDRWAAVMYVRALQSAAPATAPTTAPQTPAATTAPEVAR